MVAIDTNVLIRFLARDDQSQYQRARQLIETESIWVAMTVLLESEWVLRRHLRLPRDLVLRLLGAFAGLPNVTVQDPRALAQALDLAREGMDFADALHIAATPDGQRFATFDADFARVARRMGRIGVFAP